MTRIVFNLDGTTTVTDTRTLAEARADRIEAIKTEASARILAAWPIHRQLNANMRAIELLDLRTTRAWTAEEATEAAALRAMGASIKAIRAASDVAEAAVMAAKTREDVDAVRVEWPW
jgi:predicted GNAT superfamily acetyltransferase